MSSARRKIASNIFYLTTGQGLSWLVVAIQALVVPRYLGPAGMGTLALMGAIGGIVSVMALFGSKIYILREVARDPQTAHRLVGPAVLMSLLLAGLSWLAAGVVLALSGESSTVMLILYLSALVNIIGVSTIPVRAALQGMDKMQYTLFEVLLDKVVNTILTITVVVFNLGLVVLVASGLVTIVPVLVLYWWAFGKVSRTRPTTSPAVYKQLIRGGFYFFVADISFNIYLYLDALLLSILTSDTVLGYYSVPTRLFGSLLFAPVIIGQAILPTLSRLSVSQEGDANALSTKTLSFLVCISLPVGVGTTVMAAPFISFFYASQFLPSIPVLIILGWTAVPTYLGIGLYQILIAQDRQVQWTKLMLAAIVLNSGLNLALVPYFQASAQNGAIGSALSLFITECMIGILGIRLVGGQVATARLGLDTLKSLAAASLMGLAIWPLREMFLLLPVLAGVAVYGLLAVPLFGLSSLIKTALHKARREVSPASR